MDKIDIRQQVLRFTKARNNLLAVIAFTLANLLLTAFNADISFLFSATLPQLVFELGKTFDSETGSNVFMIIGFIIALVIIIPYFVFWILARHIRVFILVALLFFGIDSLVLLFLIFNIEFDFSLLLDIVFHGWILYYLISGVKAWIKLRGVNADVFNGVLQEIKTNTIGSTKLAVSNETNTETPEDDKEETQG
ncbi:MAG: hypothetical protein LBQ57_09120 [Spirochaetales bacterium]|jgi:hypothetical protein|nr:hypothetical protein [Spirochaetales bacterium]